MHPFPFFFPISHHFPLPHLRLSLATLLVNQPPWPPQFFSIRRPLPPLTLYYFTTLSPLPLLPYLNFFFLPLHNFSRATFLGKQGFWNRSNYVPSRWFGENDSSRGMVYVICLLLFRLIAAM